MGKIAVLGCGHGGQALAGHLAFLGMEVSLYAHKNHLGGSEKIKERGGIECHGAVNGFGKVSCVSTDLPEVLENSEIIFICLPVIAHEAIFINMLPFLEDGQMVINLSGQFSGIYQKDILRRSSWGSNIIIADITSFPYACRADTPSHVHIVSSKKKLGLASFNKEVGYAVKDKISHFFPSQLEVMSSFVESGLYDPCGITHPA